MLSRPISRDDLRNALIFGTTTACSVQTCMSKCQTRATPTPGQHEAAYRAFCEQSMHITPEQFREVLQADAWDT